MYSADQPGTQMTGAEMIVQALIDQGVEVVFGYPGGAVLPIYDALFAQNSIKHIPCARKVAPSMPPRDMPARRASPASFW